MTPSIGWDSEHAEDRPMGNGTNGPTNGHDTESRNKGVQVLISSHIEFGGDEVYIAGDDDDDAASTTSKLHLPQVGKKADPAVYKSAADDEDDGILFTNTPSWNTFSVVLRDKGTLRFVKYVSSAANGDRWDIKGEVELASNAFDDDEIDETQEGKGLNGRGGDDGDVDSDESEDEDEQGEDEDSDPNHYFEDYERERAMEEHTTTDEEDSDD